MTRQIVFTTSRLKVNELAPSPSEQQRAELCERLPELLSDSVVAELPPYFHGINTAADADLRLSRMLSESRLLLVNNLKQELVGLVFIYLDKDQAHLGYLLAEQYWGLGLAFELLSAFIAEARQQATWSGLLAGVASTNTASAKLLTKLGFVLVEEQDLADVSASTQFYQLALRPH